MVKLVLIAYHLLESSTCAYIEWLVNELMMIANKIPPGGLREDFLYAAIIVFIYNSH